MQYLTQKNAKIACDCLKQFLYEGDFDGMDFSDSNYDDKINYLVDMFNKKLTGYYDK